MEKENWKIFIISGGFYFFGNEVPAPEGYVAMNKCSMFGGFSGGKGMPGVARGAKGATVNLDQFIQEDTQIFPLSACLGIISSINLYEFEGTTIR
jgi:hypothetical protein